MRDPDIENVDPLHLADLLDMSDGADRLLRPEELAGILRHQLSLPVEFDLGGLKPGAARKLRMSATAQGLLLQGFANLLHHPNPPIELLRMTKEFAKAHQAQPDSALPVEISTLLYFASIAAALARRGTRITKLEDAPLREGFNWARQQDWVDETTRLLFDEGLKALTG